MCELEFSLVTGNSEYLYDANTEKITLTAAAAPTLVDSLQFKSSYKHLEDPLLKEDTSLETTIDIKIYQCSDFPI